MALEVFGDAGARDSVDWWFMYKLPRGIEPLAGAGGGFGTTTGREYLYCDAASDAPLALSPHQLGDRHGALYNTLLPVYRAAGGSEDTMGWIVYNDEIPGNTENDNRKGHNKGVLAFDLESDTAIWLLHSWPNFPDLPSRGMGAWNFGQTYLCTTLRGVDTARYIAEQMYHRHEPQTYQCRLPKALHKDDIFRRLANDVDVNRTDPAGDITFFSAGDQDFRLLAKNRHWARDFWIDHVGPNLKADIDVETWRRGTVPDTEDADDRHDTRDVLWINLEHLGVPYEWHYTKDHSKWGVSTSPDWVCVADINRQTSQEKRGGGSICFRHEGLWKALSAVERLKP